MKSTKNKTFFFVLSFFTLILVGVYYLFTMMTIQNQAYALSNLDAKTQIAFGETIEFQFDTSFDSYIAFYMGSDDTFEIGFHNDDKSNTIVVNSGIWATKEEPNGKPIFHLIPEYISSIGYNRITVTPIRGDGDYFISQIVVVPESEKAKFASYNQIDFEIKQYNIEMDEEAYQIILDNRADALALGVLHTDEDSVVSGKVRAEGSNYSADIRLKGDLVDHLQGDQWSYRIELKGDYCIYGLQKFSLQPIATRNGIWEYLIYEMYREQGGVAIRYDFADVYVNGVYLGVFAVEEFMEKRVIENSLSREGPIIKYDEVALWNRGTFYVPLNAIVREFVVFSENKTIASENLNAYANYAITLLNKYIYQDEPVENVFDTDKYIILYSILDLFSSEHGRHEHNMRQYYNPVTALLEPIPFDESAFLYDSMFLTDIYQSNYIIIKDILESDINNMIFAKEMLEFLAEDYPNFIARQEEQLNNITITIQRDNPSFSMDVWQVNSKREQILNLDTPEEPEIYFEAKEDALYISIYNPNPISLKMLELYQEDAYIALDQDIINPNTKMELLLPLDTWNVTLTWQTAYSDEIMTERSLETSFFVVGHAYGTPNDGNALHPPVEGYVNSLSNNPFIEYAVFTGDISQYTEKEDYEYLNNLVEETGIEIIAVPGNHDILYDQENFYDVFGSYYGYLENNANLFIWLDIQGELFSDNDARTDVPDIQLNMVENILSNKSNYDNIFVFTHEVLWYIENDAKYGSFKPHLNYNFSNIKSNFYTDLFPLFEQCEGDIYFISGDGGISNNQLYYENNGQYTYICSGVGGISHDNTLEFYVYENGYVDIKLIALNGDDPNALGRIQDYSRGGVY